MASGRPHDNGLFSVKNPPPKPSRKTRIDTNNLFSGSAQAPVPVPSPSFDFNVWFGSTLTGAKDGGVISTSSSLNGKYAVIGLYFSAHWCPPCRSFTPQLAEILATGETDANIVFISSDNDEKSFQEYHKEMPWPALPFADRTRAASISSNCGVKGIPALVLFDGKTGRMLTDKGRELVAQFGKDFARTALMVQEANDKKAAAAAYKDDLIPIGSVCQIHGLQSAPQHNGKKGRIEGFNEKKGRYSVSLQKDVAEGAAKCRTLNLKAANMFQLLKNVTITGLKSRSDLNGQKGNIIQLQTRDTGSGVTRKVVIHIGKEGLALDMSKIILPNLTRVILHGLSSQELNGLRAIVIRFEMDRGRYLVKTEMRGKLRVKQENCRF